MKKLIYLQILIFSIAMQNIIAQTWSALNSGVNGTVQSTAVYNNQLYVGGWFTTAGGLTCNKIAKWDGTNWSSVGTGTNNIVYSLCEYNGDLYVGGNFTTAGGITASGVAKWNGTSWSALGAGLDNTVYTLKTYNNELYAGGAFTNKVMKWNGSNWNTVGNNSPNIIVKTLEVHNNKLIAGGDNNIYILSNNNWSLLGGGINVGGSSTAEQINCLLNIDNFLYMGGNFWNAGGVETDNIAIWNGSIWTAEGIPSYGEVFSIIYYNDQKYIGGRFGYDYNPGTNYRGIAVLNNNTWLPVGSGISTTNSAQGVFTMCEFNGDLYVAGNFTNAGGVNVSNIAKWTYITPVNEIFRPDISVYVYPNPVSDELFIKIDGNNERLGFEIFNSTGQIVFKGHMTEKTVIHAQNFTPGVYLIKLENGSRYEFKKIIKE